jgi:hypothetical protein
MLQSSAARLPCVRPGRNPVVAANRYAAPAVYGTSEPKFSRVATSVTSPLIAGVVLPPQFM